LIRLCVGVLALGILSCQSILLLIMREKKNIYIYIYKVFWKTRVEFDKPKFRVMEKEIIKELTWDWLKYWLNGRALCHYYDLSNYFILNILFYLV
jgi:hypothetical protein